MTSKNSPKASPPAEFQKKGNPCSTDPDQETSRSLDGGNTYGNDEDENHHLFGQSEVGEPGLHQYPMSTEELYKRCKWFEGTEEPSGARAAFSFSQSSQPKMSPKRFFHQVKSRRQVSSTAICSLEEEEKHFAFSSQQPAAASLKTKKILIEICLPPGCIPSSTIVQFTRKESQSGTEERMTTEAGEELDIWVKDILDQMNFAKPEVIPRLLRQASSLMKISTKMFF